MSEKKKPIWVKIGIFAVVALALYFGNVELQTYLGEKVLQNSGLELNSYDDALAKAAQQEKLVLADMSAIWCPTCRSLDKNVFSNESVQEVIEDKYIFARIEYESDEGAAFMDRYDVRGFPTLLVLDAKGNKLRQLPVTTDPEQFLANL